MNNAFSDKSHVTINNSNKRCQSNLQKRCGKATLVIMSLLFISVAYAGPAEQQRANYIHERLTGVIPSETVLIQMEQAINNAMRTSIKKIHFIFVRCNLHLSF